MDPAGACCGVPIRRQLPMYRHAIAFLAVLSFSTAVRAEAALADLILLMPKIILVGIYQELAQPWVLGTLWGIAALCWVAYFVTGRDAAGDVMDHIDPPSKALFNFTSYGAMTFLAIAASLYVVLGYALSGPPPPKHGLPGQPRTGTHGPARPAPAMPLPYPHGKSAANPQGQWPTTTGPLPGTPIRAYGGGGYVMLRNTGDEALWARMCAAEDERCTPLRQVYLAPRTAYLMERITEGRYRVAYTQITGGKRSGTSAVIRPDQKSTSGETLVLDDFQPKS